MTPVAIYCRVSTDEQADRGTSLTDQSERCRRYCQDQGWDISNTYIDDGVSGATTERPALQELLRAAAESAFSTVVVTDPDRFSRDLVDGLTLERDLARLGIAVVYLIQPTMGTLERQLRGVIAEEERRKTRDRMIRGIRAVANQGYWPGGAAPYGYRIVRNPEGHSNLVIDEQEADTIRSMIDALVDQRLSTNQVAEELNQRSVPTPSTSRRRSPKNPTRWNHRRVRDVLSTANGISGTWTYKTASGDIPIAVPAIIDETRHAQLRTRLKETTTGPGATKRKYTYLLSGRLRSACGAMMYGLPPADATRARVYQCTMSTSDRGPERCECRRVNAEVIETAVWDTIFQVLTQPDRLKTLAGLNDTALASDSHDLVSLNRRIKRVEHALADDIAELLISGADPQSVNHATVRLETKLRRLRQQRDQVLSWASARQDHANRSQRLSDLAHNALHALSTADDDLKRNVIDLLNLTIRVTDWKPCITCAGKGLLANPNPHRRKKIGRPALVCPTCKRHRWNPIIEIEGALPDTANIAHPTRGDHENYPFQLKPAG